MRALIEDLEAKVEGAGASTKKLTYEITLNFGAEVDPAKVDNVMYGANNLLNPQLKKVLGTTSRSTSIKRR